MLIQQPVFLTLILLLLTGYYLWKPTTRPLRFLWLLCGLLIIIAMSGPAIRIPGRAGQIIAVLDRSLSVSSEELNRQEETIRLLDKSRKRGDKLAVVSFAEKAVVETMPGEKFQSVQTNLNGGLSNLNEALQTAAGLCSQETSNSIFIMSDGQWTGTDPLQAVSDITNADISINYQHNERKHHNDVYIQKINHPVSLTPGQAYVINAWVWSPTATAAEYTLTRGRTIISKGSTTLNEGYNRLAFSDRAKQTGDVSYTLQIKPDLEDSIPENNTAHFFVGIDSKKPILHLTLNKGSSLANLLEAGHLKVITRTPSEFTCNLDSLAAFSAVIIENVPAGQIGVHGMENLKVWVQETGGGLMFTGGQNSYGPGGYFKSPLADIMPISMELRTEHRKLSLAIVVVLDRSGSMAAPAGGGKTKMDLANIGTAQVLDLLSATDELGVIAVDSAPHTIVDLVSVDLAESYRQSILGINSQGGGIFVYEGLKAAATMLVNASAGTRHIILFADANDAEQPGQYKELLEKCRKAEVTVSVVGLGTEYDKDADFLKDVALRGEGRIFFSKDAAELPRLFAQDTFAVARSTFVDEACQFKFNPGILNITGTTPPTPPLLDGYNLCYIKPDANLAAYTTDEYNAPILASKQVGAGRVLCYMGEADGKFAASIANWNYVGNFFTGLARWAAGSVENLPPVMMLEQKVKDGACVISLHLDPDRESMPFDTPPEIKYLKSARNAIPQSFKSQLQWQNADLLECVISMEDGDTILPVIEFTGGMRKQLTPACLPYSPEYTMPDSAKGIKTLKDLAGTTGGAERLTPGAIWDTLPKKVKYMELAPWLYIAAMIVFLVGILQRRTGIPFSYKWRKSAPDKAAAPEEYKAPVKAREYKQAKVQPEKQAEPVNDTDDGEATLNAMAMARKRASQRTKRK